MPSVHAIGSIVFLMGILNAAIINPTNSNATHQYYVNTDSTLPNNFQSGYIHCSTTYCHIVCDENDGCYGVNIDASISDTLHIECPSNSSCYSFTVNGPKKNLIMNCWGVESCRNGQIYTSETENINLSCNNSITPFENKACLSLSLNASHSTSVTIDCLGRESCYAAKFHLDYAQYATINANGYNALYESRFYANYMSNQLDVVCRGDWVCYGMIIYSNYTKHNVSLSCHGSCEAVKIFATAADIESSVSITCNGSDTCRFMSIYCPILGSCNINCAINNSCNHVLIHNKNATQSSTTLTTTNPTLWPTQNPTIDPTIDSTKLIKATYNDPSDHTGESSYDTLFTVVIVIFIILVLMFIVCVLIYLKLHDNDEKHDDDYRQNN